MNAMARRPEPIDRWIIRGAVELLSPMAIRTGLPERREPAGIEPRPGKPQMPRSGAGAGQEEPEVYAVELDVNGFPFIPATAFKGMLRGRVAEARSDADADIVWRLLGDRPKAGRSDAAMDAEVSIGGRAEFRNLRISADPEFKPQIRGATAIDAARRTAGEGLLRHQRVVDRGTKFDVEIVVDGVEVEDVAYLVAVLRSIDGTSPSGAVGASTGAGFGRLQWDFGSEQVSRIDATTIVAWIEGNVSDWRATPALSGDPLAKLHQAVAKHGSFRSHGIFEIPLEIQIDGHFLVSQAFEPKEDGAKGEAQRRPIQDSLGSRRAYLPGTSLKGALRAQAMRIWRTLSGDMSLTAAPEPIVWLFGDTAQAGNLKASDFCDIRDREPRQVEMVAIDRFTGGHAAGAKFSVQAYESPLLTGAVTVRVEADVAVSLTGKTPTAADSKIGMVAQALGLLALTLRDLAEGDIPLGFGTRKGFGAATLAGKDGGAALPDVLRSLGRALGASDDKDAENRLEAAVQAFRDSLH